MSVQKYEILFDPPREIPEPIEQGFHEYNLSHLGEVIHDYDRVAIIARNDAGRVVDGVCGEAGLGVVVHPDSMG